MNEAEIIKTAQQGSLSAFNRLVMSYQGLAYSVAYRVMGDQERAADATQEAFIKAFKAIEQYRGGSFKSWLLRIVSNTCYDQIRYEKRRPSQPLESEDYESDYSPYMVDETERPEESLMRNELGDMLQYAINQLPKDQRLVLIFSDVEGMNYQEVSDILDVPLGTVKSRLSRARGKLRDILLEQELLPKKYRLQK